MTHRRSTEEVEALGLLKALGQAVLSVDHRTGLIISASPEAAEMFGYETPEQMIGESVLGHYADPRERKEIAARFLSDPRVVERGYLVLEAMRTPRGAQEPVPVRMTILLRWGEDGELARLDVAAENITERVDAERAFLASEERFRVVFEESAIGKAITTLDGHILRVNRSFCRIVGQSEDALLQSKVQDLLPVEGEPDLLEPGVPRAPRDLHLRKGSDGEVWANLEVFWLRDQQGRTHSGVVTLQDVTERRRGEAAMARVARLESLGVLAGGIAHDFNNLLTAIIGHISLAQLEAEGRPWLLDVLTEALRAGERASELTRQLMVFAKGGTPVREEAALDDLLVEVTRFCLRGSSVTGRFDLADDLWLVECDVDQVGQLFHNLVLNALQAQPKGGTVTLTARNALVEEGDALPLAPGRYLRIQVADEGPGIPEDHLQHVFDPYFTTRTTGSGLGLASVHAITRKHGGHVEVHSTPGQGSTFTVYLPAIDGSERPSPPAAPSDSLPPMQGRVLVMDDQESVRAVAQALLERLGLEVHTARHGRDAVDAWLLARERRRPFEVVILDLTVPGAMGGAETLTELLALDPSVCAVVSSGYSEHPVVLDYRRHGFVASLAKPYTLRDLASVLGSLLQSARG